MALVALKIDVDTYRGTREGAARLADLLERLDARATFLFSLGPDHTGWAIRRAFRPGFFSKVQRTSVVSHYGLKTLMYGTLLPAPDIGKRTQGIMRAVRDAGHEVGIHTWDHVRWQDNVRQRDATWTQRQMQQAFDRFVDIFGAPPATHGAAGWQMNDHAFECLDTVKDHAMSLFSRLRSSAPTPPVEHNSEVATAEPQALRLIDQGNAREDESRIEEALELYDAAVQLQYPTASGLEPYVFAGGGAVTLHQVGTSGQNKTRAAGTFGLGLNYQVPNSPFGVFAEGKSWLYKLENMSGALAGFDKTQFDVAWSGGISYRFPW